MCQRQARHLGACCVPSKPEWWERVGESAGRSGVGPIKVAQTGTLLGREQSWEGSDASSDPQVEDGLFEAREEAVSVI